MKIYPWQKQILDRLIAGLPKQFKHRHKWKDTRINPWFISTEQKCSCGAYRHHLFEDVRGFDCVWREGKHPDKPVTNAQLSAQPESSPTQVLESVKD